MNIVIPVENGDVLTAVRGFLQKLLELGVVDALFVPLEADGGTITPALVTDPARLNQANPLMPIMPINSARAISALTGKHVPAQLGIVLRSCEIRALIELVKLQQATLEGVTLIGVDCPGTFELTEYIEKQHEGHITSPTIWQPRRRVESRYLKVSHFAKPVRCAPSQFPSIPPSTCIYSVQKPTRRSR